MRRSPHPLHPSHCGAHRCDSIQIRRDTANATVTTSCDTPVVAAIQRWRHRLRICAAAPSTHLMSVRRVHCATASVIAAAIATQRIILRCSYCDADAAVVTQTRPNAAQPTPIATLPLRHRPQPIWHTDATVVTQAIASAAQPTSNTGQPLCIDRAHFDTARECNCWAERQESLETLATFAAQLANKPTNARDIWEI